MEASTSNKTLSLMLNMYSRAGYTEMVIFDGFLRDV